MRSAYRSKTSQSTTDNCSICLSPLEPGTALLTLSCNHKYHFQCLASSVRAQNNQCPLCRATIDASIVELLTSHRASPYEERLYQPIPRPAGTVYQATPQVRVSSGPITVSTKLEYGGQMPHIESIIYGLVTLDASSSQETASLSRVPIDLICVVDQSASMSGAKMILLKETLVYITEQLTEHDRLAIISFDNKAYDRSHGLKLMTPQNKQKLNVAINYGIQDGMSTYIGGGLEMAIELYRQRQTRNPVSAMFLLTDGQDDEIHDYSKIMKRLPRDVACHTFGYGSDHAAGLLVQLAELGNGGTFTHIDKHEAVGPAFAMALASLLTCVAQRIRVQIQFNGEYRMTQVHSIYGYEPERLPASMVTFKLNDLNAGEKRHLIFQLYVPRVNETSSADHMIGHVSVVYTDPNSRRSSHITAVPFHLVRSSHLTAAHLQISRTIDVQRNRIETALVLRQAMEEQNYSRSRALLRAQADRIGTSVSAHDPFCQQLIRDLQHRYSSEQDYRSTYLNIYMQHATERGTYSTENSSSAQIYGNPYQLNQMAHYRRRYE